MDTQTLSYIFIGLTFALYIGIAIWSRAGSTSEFYVAGGHVHPVANGMATAADWMSAASFISMAGIIAFAGYDASVYLMGWTGGYVLLALLLAPYLRKFGQFTVPDFIGERYYSRAARVVAVICLIVISFTYIAGQMRGVGVVFSRFLELPIEWGVIVGMGIVFSYAVLGGMKGITYTQVAQYCVLIFAYLVPAIFISILITGNPAPQLGLGAETAAGVSVLERLDAALVDLGFNAYTEASKSKIDIFAITLALMVGTAGLPHVIVRFFTVPKVADARRSAGFALVFIALLYTTAPAVGAFARINFIDSVHEKPYAEAPGWVKTWEGIGLIAWLDKNNDGVIQYGPGAPFEGRVRTKMADIGQYVTPGQSLGQIFSTDLVQIRLPLTDSQLALVDLPLAFEGTDSNLGPQVKFAAHIAGGRHEWTQPGLETLLEAQHHLVREGPGRQAGSFQHVGGAGENCLQATQWIHVEC